MGDSSLCGAGVCNVVSSGVKKVKQSWIVLSPDEIPISPTTYRSKYEAKKALGRWVKGFERQGYYADSGGRRIAPDVLADYCKIERQE